MHPYPQSRLILGVTSALAGAAVAGAQPPACLATLTVPPPAVGTCMPAPVATARPGGAGDTLPGRRLVMTTRSPGGRREITVYTDAQGRMQRYMESAHRMREPGSSVGETVAAGMTSAGELRGMLFRTTVAMKRPADQRHDTAALRTMRGQATTTQASEPLGAAQQARIRTVAAWLLKRCSPEGRDSIEADLGA